MVGITYSTLYDITQFFREGAKKYFSNEWNIIDVIYILFGLS